MSDVAEETSPAPWPARSWSSRPSGSRRADGGTPGDDALPGVGDEEITLRDAFRVGGAFTFVTLASLVALDDLEVGDVGDAGPRHPRFAGDQRRHDGVHQRRLVGAFLIFGAVPMGWLGDRFRRSRVIAWASLFFG